MALRDKDEEQILSTTNRKTLVTIKTIVGLIVVSAAVYMAFFMVACDDTDLYCKSVYEWEEIFLAIGLVLGGIIGSAAALLVLIKLIRGGRKNSGIDWQQMNDDHK